MGSYDTRHVSGNKCRRISPTHTSTPRSTIQIIRLSLNIPGYSRSFLASAAEADAQILLWAAERSPVDRCVFEEDLVIATERHNEDDGLHVIKAMDPLAPFAPLTTDVNHTKLVHAVCYAGHHAAQCKSGGNIYSHSPHERSSKRANSRRARGYRSEVAKVLGTSGMGQRMQSLLSSHADSENIRHAFLPTGSRLLP